MSTNFQEISGFSKLSFKYIHQLTDVLLKIVTEIIFTRTREKREKLLKELDEQSLELLDVWDGLKSHVFSTANRSPCSSCKNVLPAQISQLSFLMHYIRSGQYFCTCLACTNSEVPRDIIYYHDLKGCFQVIKKLLEESSGSDNGL